MREVSLNMNIHHYMDNLRDQTISSNSPFFRVEKDFQHCLAGLIKGSEGNCVCEKKFYGVNDRTERDGIMRTDIVTGDAAIELTYRPRNAVIKGQTLDKGQTEDSVITGYYKFWFDVWKIEQLVNSQASIRSGHAIILTNNLKYWNADSTTPMVKNPNWWLREFVTYEARPEVHGELKVHWDGDKVRKVLPKSNLIPKEEVGRHNEGWGKLTFRGKYRCDWRDWRDFKVKNGRFRYLALSYTP